MSGRAKVSKKKHRTSRSARAGVVFPVSRMMRYMRKSIAKRRISPAAPVYVAAVLEYLVAEVVELAGRAAWQNKKSRIIPRHILLAVANDQELHHLLQGVTISTGGVLPNIRPELLNKTKGHRKWAQGASATSGSSAPKPISRSAQSKPVSSRKHAPAAKTASKSAAKATTAARGAAAKKGGPAAKAASSGITVLSEKSLFLGQKMTVIQGDISTLSCDAIVHPTNASMYLGGEVGSALLKAGGADLQREVTSRLSSHGSLGVSEAAISPGHNLPAANVIHVHSPQWGSATSEDDLAKAVSNCLSAADSGNLKSIAFPSIGSGANRFPKELAARIIMKSIKNYFISVMASSIKQVYFVLYDSESVGIYKAELGRLDND